MISQDLKQQKFTIDAEPSETVRSLRSDVQRLATDHSFR